jgi:hypothetical protein
LRKEGIMSLEMQTRKKWVLATAAMASVVLPAVITSAEEGGMASTTGVYKTENGEISYKITDNKITLTKLHGTDTSLVIPGNIDGKPVVGIDSYAFEGVNLKLLLLKSERMLCQSKITPLIINL